MVMREGWEDQAWGFFFRRWSVKSVVWNFAGLLHVTEKYPKRPL